MLGYWRYLSKWSTLLTRTLPPALDLSISPHPTPTQTQTQHKQRIKPATKTLLEEPRAELAALHTLRLMLQGGHLQQEQAQRAVGWRG